MKKELLKICLFSILMMIIVSLSSAYDATIRLKNGTIIGSEISLFDGTSITIKEPLLGIMKVSNNKIININSPLHRKEFKDEIIEPLSPKHRLQDPGKKISVPLFSKKTILKTSQPEFLSEWKEKGRTSVYISGGASHVDGGDLNGMIRGYNEFIRDWNDHYQTDYSIDWKEFGWIQNLKAEVLLNLSNSFSLGLGVEYLAKTQKGAMALNDAASGTFNDSLYYYNYSLEDNFSSWPQPKLIVIPVTCDLYFFIPAGKKAEVFVKAGVGYYRGTLKYNESYLRDYKYQADYYGSDDTFWYSWIDNYLEDGTRTYEAKCKAVGYQAGIGFDIKLFSVVSLVVEGNYRYVNLKDWSGNGSESLSWTEESGRSDLGTTTASANESDSWGGKIWYYELYDSGLNKQYKRIFLHEEAPEANEWIKNVRQAEINLNGFSLRAGIKITF